MAILVTVGGAYATWNYTVSNGKVDSQTDSVTLSITDKVETSLESGTITIEENSVVIQFDDDGNHNAKLNITGQLVISFTGTPTSGTLVNGLNLKCTVTHTCGQYKNADVLMNNTELFAGREVGNGTDQSQAYAKWVIEGADLEKLITLNGTVSAPTAEDYDNLKNAVSGKTLTFTVSAVQ